MLSGKQKRYLRSIAQTQRALFQIGKDGLSDNLIHTVDDALEARELVKIKMLKTVSEDHEEIIFDLARLTHSEIVQTIGNTFVLYRRSREPRIILP
ncbi:MAG: ribosome assembly RNA-binding protein YhbY [Solobacterium sp.]|nr:ribosome assembly RNA-binding protein YhbY [Solobacterium sp.]MBR2668608.1 ribosome assembly RNA-binding protein YhbY [Solobacterium sp.]